MSDDRPLAGRDEHELDGGHHDHGHDDGGGQHDTHDHDHSHERDHDHDHHHHDVDTLGVAVVTVSSSRSMEEDPAGDALVETFEDAGHEIATRDLIGDDYDGAQSTLSNLVERDDVDVVVTTGGTGVTPDDVTVEAAERLFAKRLPGFGELFRTESYDEVGVMVVATRATAGIAEGVPVFCLPGSENAARLGGRIAVKSAGHLAGLAGRDRGDDGAGHHDDHGDGHH
ncbi:MogA/MoaB family molybdenum cofactor biosynthesis protein [Salinigranum salinum]|uniref:MogA/MoaB family molybdenum cofactor biosynthesis protein n=1 Tax=Salinigranum salinum TaxID=1364937 RepID=UPI001260E707|nr:molybdenum cofactor synthesis domain-containing protein [Salinigranum salinum]